MKWNVSSNILKHNLKKKKNQHCAELWWNYEIQITTPGRITDGITDFSRWNKSYFLIETLRNTDYDLCGLQSLEATLLVGITDDYRKQECLVLTPKMISLKQIYFSDIPYPRYHVKCSFCLRMVASGWSGQKEDICPFIKKSMATTTSFHEIHYCLNIYIVVTSILVAFRNSGKVSYLLTFEIFLLF